MCIGTPQLLPYSEQSHDHLLLGAKKGCASPESWLARIDVNARDGNARLDAWWEYLRWDCLKMDPNPNLLLWLSLNGLAVLRHAQMPALWPFAWSPLLPILMGSLTSVATWFARWKLFPKTSRTRLSGYALACCAGLSAQGVLSKKVGPL